MKMLYFKEKKNNLMNSLKLNIGSYNTKNTSS